MYKYSIDTVTLDGGYGVKLRCFDDLSLVEVSSLEFSASISRYGAGNFFGTSIVSINLSNNAGRHIVDTLSPFFSFKFLKDNLILDLKDNRYICFQPFRDAKDEVCVTDNRINLYGTGYFYIDDVFLSDNSLNFCCRLRSFKFTLSCYMDYFCIKKENGVTELNGKYLTNRHVFLLY